MYPLSFLMFFISFTAVAQTNPINIHFISGRVVSTQYAYLHTGFDSYLRIHEKKGEKISINLVEHIEGIDQHGNYRYFKPITLSYNKIWAERGFTSDRIEIYHTDIATGTMAATYKPKSCLYSKDGGPFKLLKLKHLKKDLIDCPASLEYLKKGKRIATGQVLVSVASYSTIVAGIVSFANNASDDDDDPAENSGPSIPPAIIIGAVGSWIPVLMNNAKRGKYLEALKVYK